MLGRILILQVGLDMVWKRIGLDWIRWLRQRSRYNLTISFDPPCPGRRVLKPVGVLPPPCA